MSRPILEHIAWAKTEPRRLRHNLADSAVAAPDFEAMGLPSRPGPLGRDDAVVAQAERAWGERIGAPGGRVIATAGASEAIAIVFLGLLGPGDEVLVESPGYEPHRLVPLHFGATVRGFPRDGVRPVTAAVEAALGPATRLVVVSDLHNPTGTALSEADARALDALATARDFLVMCDETFRDAGERPIGTLASLGPRWITTSTLTKIYGLGGLRIGWVAGDPGLLARCANAHNALSAQPAVPSLELALALTPHLDALRVRARGILAENHAAWTRFVAARPAFAAPASRGTTTFVRFAADGAGDAFARHVARFDVAVVPGRFFGEPRGVRIALGSLPEAFADALAVLGPAADTFLAETANAGEPA